MNNEENKIFYDVLDTDGKELYDTCMKDIKWDFSNISYLMKYLTNNDDNNVIDAIFDYLKEKYDVESEEVKADLLPKLIEEHTSNYHSNLINLHEMINFGENCIENAVIFEDEDAIDRFFDNLKNLRIMVNKFSDFILNFCAIMFIRKRTSNKELEKINKKYKIDYQYQSFIEIMSVNTEFIIVSQKLKRFISLCYGEKYNEEIKISLYDANMLSELVVKTALNKFSKELITWLINNGCKYEAYDFIINSICFYCAVWAVAMDTSDYQTSIDYYIKEFYVHVIDTLKETIKDNNKNYYSDLVNGFDDWKKQIDAKEDLFSEKNKKALHKQFEKTICEFDYKVFTVFYAETLHEINELIK